MECFVGRQFTSSRTISRTLNLFLLDNLRIFVCLVSLVQMIKNGNGFGTLRRKMFQISCFVFATTAYEFINNIQEQHEDHRMTTIHHLRAVLSCQQNLRWIQYHLVMLRVYACVFDNGVVGPLWQCLIEPTFSEPRLPSRVKWQTHSFLTPSA